MNYVNFHSHTQYSNIMTPDSTISNRDRALRAFELGQTVLTSVEHGWCGRFIETVELSKEYGLKPLIGAETYFVKDRLEKDKTNAHLIVLAKNENGRKALNRILSEANTTGFYYKPRIDISLVSSLPSDDIWVTTACVGGIWQYEDYESLIPFFKEKFGSNFFLEVQYHKALSQEMINYKVLSLSNQYDIRIIAGMDSHMISSEQNIERDNYLLSRGISYPNEENWTLDFPSCDTAAKRFTEQNVLNKYKIEEALDNTNIFQDVEPYNSPIFDNETIKLPSLYPNKTQDEKNERLGDLVMSQWEKEKQTISDTDIPHYEKEIQKELDIIYKTKMADYFLLDYEIIKKGKEKGGSITMTGRGSAPSFYLSKLLGFTTIDRISASVKLFPERFISAERLLESKSLPDIDFNLGTPEIFAQAQVDVMGEGHAYQMIALNTMQVLAAWKMYARASNVDYEVANKVSDQIQKYLDVLKYSDEETEEVGIFDYLDEEYHQAYTESQKYLGLINSVVPHPCGYLLYSDGDMREEFSLIKIKTGNVEHICVACDGLFAENYKMLKNDLLKVSVVDLIYKTYERIGKTPHSLPELINLCENDEKVWNIYKYGHTLGINQVEQNASRGRAMNYAPENISELSAFVAAVRPGFQSNYKQFEAREQFSYGIPSLDGLIQTKEFPQSYLLYQENAMQVLAYAGIPISQTYDILKNIAKKRAEKVFGYKGQFAEGMKKRLIEEENQTVEEAERIANITWQIIEDSSRYSFNACVSGKTVIQQAGKKGLRTPTVEEMFMIMNDKEFSESGGHKAPYGKYKLNEYGSAFSMCDDGRIRKNKIVDIYYQGKRQTYKVQTRLGAYIVCTDNHKFPTPFGDKTLSKLTIGDGLYVRGHKGGSLLDKIISIDPMGEEDVYDIEMQAPYHNFVSETGLVTCNSHSYSMAGDSLYGAYLKAHYPLEFYETLLRLLEEDGNKDRLTRARIEAQEAFGISFPRFLFGQDNREIIANREKNEIASSIKTIKGFGSSIGEDLYNVAQGFKDGDFIDLLIYSEENGLLSSKWESLIKIGYFQQFGNNKKLLNAFAEFKGGKNRFNGALKPETKTKRALQLKKMFEETPNERLPFISQIGLENEILGYMQSTYPIDKHYIYITDINTAYSPRLQAYCLNNGKQESIKIQKHLYEKKPFLVGDIIKCTGFQKKPSVQYINGEFVKSENEFTWWVIGYDLVNVDEFAKMLDK